MQAILRKRAALEAAAPEPEAPAPEEPTPEPEPVTEDLFDEGEREPGGEA